MIPPKSGLQEITLGLKVPRLWALLGWFDIRQRYRRSMLGPFWLTISTGILVTSLGLLWSTLFKMDYKDYMPFFAIGHVIWGFIAMQLGEAGTGFTQFEHILKQVRLPLSVYILRITARNLIILAHNFVIVIVVIAIFHPDLGWDTLLFIPGIIVLTLFLIFVSLTIAIMCTRYRDIQPIVQNIIMIAFFITPIMWKPETLDKHMWIADFNPLAHLISIVRLPLLGLEPPGTSWVVSLAATAVFMMFSIFLLQRYRTRITYWL
jgi:ABC-type polysaccharide/polyol phosphate export permease